MGAALALEFGESIKMVASSDACEAADQTLGSEAFEN